MSDTAAPSPSPNAIAGTWRLVSSQVDQDGTIIDVFGPKPGGLLVFTEDLHFVEVLRDTTVPGFASDDRTEGTPDENATAVAGALGQYGTAPTRSRPTANSPATRSTAQPSPTGRA